MGSMIKDSEYQITYYTSTVLPWPLLVPIISLWHSITMTYFLSILLLYAVSLLACAVNGQTQPSSCSLLTDIPSSCAPSPDCTGLVCNSLYGTVTLTIVKCSDPLAVELGLRPSGSTAVSRINYYVGYYVGGPEVVTDSSTIGQLTPLHAHFSRNTTHLNFTVSYAVTLSVYI